MIKNKLKSFFAFLSLVLIFNSCKDECYYYDDVTEYHEILADVTEVKNSFAVKADFAIKKPGNIYSYNNYLFVAELNEGIHILDNTNPASPIPLKFIQLKGNTNFAVANDVLLADNGADLLSINFSDLQNIVIDKRTENVNPDILRANNKIVAGYDVVTSRKKIMCDEGRNQMSNSSMMTSSSSGGTVSTGKGGSMSKFAVLGQYLYIAHSSVLQPVDITNPSNPQKKLSIIFSSDNVETIFPYQNFLYFGTTSGVLIYDCMTNPEVPAYRRTLTHALGCDPVVVSNDFCFSTVRNNTECRSGNTVNMLNIYDVSNVNSPLYVRNFNLENPYGLGVKDNLVFICQADKGLSVYTWNSFDASITHKHTYSDIHAYDVIVNNNTLIVTADNGLFQFDFTDPDNIKYLSTLVDY